MNGYKILKCFRKEKRVSGERADLSGDRSYCIYCIILYFLYHEESLFMLVKINSSFTINPGMETSSCVVY